jgi:hypothetical protein
LNVVNPVSPFPNSNPNIFQELLNLEEKMFLKFKLFDRSCLLHMNQMNTLTSFHDKIPM